MTAAALSRSSLNRHRYGREGSVLLAYLAILALLAVLRPAFFHSQFQLTLVSTAPLLVAAAGMTLVILAGQIDISVGSQFSVCTVVVGALAAAGLPLPLAAAGAVLAGAICGALNGALVAILRLPSIVATLATMVILRGGLLWITSGSAVHLPDGFQWLGFSQSTGQILIVGAAIVLFALMALAMRWIRGARAVYAVGSDPHAARLAGIRPQRVTFWVFVSSGALAGIAAVVGAVKFPLLYSNTGDGLELQVIAAVVVGGCAITGGSGNLFGTLVGVALLGVIASAQQFLGIRPEWARAVQGAIILLAVRRHLGSSTAGNESNASNNLIALAVLVVAELLIFSALSDRFATLENVMLIARLSVELGLLSLAMTLVIVTGGIDLSVGSTMALCAVIFGKLFRDAGLPPYVAALAAIIAGTAMGGLNALLITRRKIPPLIITLGTYSLFRGVAEGITGGVDNFTNFPARFLSLGQGHIGWMPVQVPILIIAAIAFWITLHRGVLGRRLSAIGYNAGGAHYAGINVERSISWAYIASGFCAGLAAVIYVARLGQAKADAGNGYELTAITAVVLGGTSIFGGRGSIVGTLLGLFAIAILRDGLLLIGQPSELAALLTGLLLLIAIGFDTRLLRSRALSSPTDEEFSMRNSQLATLCAVILAAALMIALSNVWLAKSLSRPAAITTAPSATPATPAKAYTIAMMPKSKGNAYFIACRKGADEAAAALGVNLVWDGPTDPDPARQNEIVETWIAGKVDAIAVAVENRDAISTALRKARSAGIKVVTWDSDAATDARDFFVNQATPQGIGFTLMDNAARVLNNKGDFAIITASLTAANMNEWRKYIEERRAAKYPDMHLVVTEPCDDKQNVAFDKAGAILNAHPEVKLLMAICSPGVPGAAEAVQQSGRKDVKVLGLGLPNDNKRYVHSGITDDIVLWNTMDLGYLTVYAAHDLLTGTLKTGATATNAGRLGAMQIEGDNILLGKPFTFTNANIDQFDF